MNVYIYIYTCMFVCVCNTHMCNTDAWHTTMISLKTINHQELAI